MHRSGTSVTMAAIEALGVEVGEGLLPPGPDNETGYWEDRAVMELNERLLAALGMTWDSVALIPEAAWTSESVAELRREALVLLRSQFAGHRTWGFKDPRSIRVLPFWQAVLSELGAPVKYVVAFRNPSSVAASLAYRNQFARAKSYYLWLSHYVPYLDRLLGEDCLYVDYDSLVDSADLTLRRIGSFIHGAERMQGRELPADFLETTLRADLRHARFEEPQIDADTPTILKRAFVLLQRLAAGVAPGLMADINALQRRYEEDATLLREMDCQEREAGKWRSIVKAEEPIRDKIEKMGLYQADLSIKMERVDSRHEAQAKEGEALCRGLAELGERMGHVQSYVGSTAARVEDIQEKVVVQIDELRRAFASTAARVEDVQEKVVVQIDELHRALASALNPGSAQPRSGYRDKPQDLIAAQALIESIYQSTSWRITKPVRAAKILAARALAYLKR